MDMCAYLFGLGFWALDDDFIMDVCDHAVKLPQ
jgi:hypothetical protein